MEIPYFKTIIGLLFAYNGIVYPLSINNDSKDDKTRRRLRLFRIYNTIVRCLYILLTTHVLYDVVTAPDRTTAIQYATFLMHCILVGLLPTATRYAKSYFWEVHQAVLESSGTLSKYSPFFSSQIIRHNSRIAKLDVDEKRSFYTFITLINVTYFPCMLLPVIVFWFFRKDAAHGDNQNLLYACFMCRKGDSLPVVCASYVIQMMISTHISYVVPLTTMVCMFIILHVKKHHQILIAAVSNIQPASRQYAELSEDRMSSRVPQSKQYDRTIILYLSKCVEHHKSLLRLMNNFIKSFKWILLISTTHMVCAGTTDTFLIMKHMKAGSSNSMTVIQQILELSVIYPFLFLYCYLGETLLQVNDSFAEKLYSNVTWYEERLEFQKYLLMLLRLVQQPARLKITQNHIASYALFASALKATYSFGNLLYSSQSNKNA